MIQGDALYIRLGNRELGNREPEGVIELDAGVNLDTTADDGIVGIEILNASKKMDLDTVFRYELSLNNPLAEGAASV